ncbi:hypothetical protein EGR_10034 [Echinococcus granulosus]|uniref:Uncharacterized protein n=1 Tax=Echinococcus granulosus TaxID=6210 RepID=W6U9D5_ECHGR|nr:hypothetical protein EGR_10034 [Echinococcus granulosus]EUB55097.1 hypothetical protein EGR_10034 [Echinococcus granulosus]
MNILNYHLDIAKMSGSLSCYQRLITSAACFEVLKPCLSSSPLFLPFMNPFIPTLLYYPISIHDFLLIDLSVFNPSLTCSDCYCCFNPLIISFTYSPSQII